MSKRASGLLCQRSKRASSLLCQSSKRASSLLCQRSKRASGLLCQRSKICGKKIISNNENTEILKLHELETLRELMVLNKKNIKICL